MGTLPQILELTTFRRYNDRLYELRQFYIVYSMRYISVFTISTNECHLIHNNIFINIKLVHVSNLTGPPSRSTLIGVL
jgi:hypothetical protein